MHFAVNVPPGRHSQKPLAEQSWMSFRGGVWPAIWIAQLRIAAMHVVVTKQYWKKIKLVLRSARKYKMMASLSGHFFDQTILQMIWQDNKVQAHRRAIAISSTMNSLSLYHGLISLGKMMSSIIHPQIAFCIFWWSTFHPFQQFPVLTLRCDTPYSATQDLWIIHLTLSINHTLFCLHTHFLD